ncbi:MAG: hypothetical protein GWO07_13560 [Candidatus Dadabacteria bacterium]|nr:hypothetical protein [Candidatus Dadabacteria bacterium]NIS09754.1 hypothetical protein [Candidatus Dadabacteria bacterium]NIV41119.1 hypothetical protein [Candidatus Dadabacteria bacterium]NIX16212.1 hypothetical protein [Candidatus Dadabacteria bacterium]NIY22835.1 hypothetical protein [Candidatus Dadabacteria bacterium]
MNIKNLNIIDTIKRAVRYDGTLYPEIEEKEEYNNQAILVIVLASLLSAIGIEGMDITGIIISFILELICCAFWVGIITAMVFKVLQVRIDPVNFARCIGIALFPLMLMILAIIPYIGAYLAIASIIIAIISVIRVVIELTELEVGLSVVLAMTGSIPFIIMTFYLTYEG